MRGLVTGLLCIAYLPHKYAMHARARRLRRIRESERGDCQTRVSWVNEQLLDVLGGSPAPEPAQTQSLSPFLPIFSCPFSLGSCIPEQN